MFILYLIAAGFIVLFLSCQYYTRYEQGLLIALEGNIACGKSTLCRALEKNYCVYLENISPKLLALFYSNCKQYAFSMQLNTTKDRVFELQLAALKGKNVVFDRQIIGNLAFVYQHVLAGNINEQELEAFMDVNIANMKKGLNLLREIVYLHVPVKRCLNNVRKRQNVDSDIPQWLLEQLEILHSALLFAMMIYFNYPIKVLAPEEYTNVTDFEKTLTCKGGILITNKYNIESENKEMVYFNCSLNYTSLSEETFPKLRKESYRRVLNSTLRDNIFKALAKNKTVVLYNYEENLIEWVSHHSLLKDIL